MKIKKLNESVCNYIDTYNGCKIYECDGKYSCSTRNGKTISAKSVDELKKQIDTANKSYTDHYNNLPESLNEDVKVCYETDLTDFEFWSGAQRTASVLTDKELSQISDILGETAPEGMTETQINDIFWFEDDWIAEMLGYEDFETLYNERSGNVEEAVSKDTLVEKPVYNLDTQHDSRKSFYNKAKVDTGDKGDKNKLYSYDTLVAEVVDGKPVVYGTYSATTLRHIKEWLKQLGYKADSAKQIMQDYGQINESKPINESIDDVKKIKQCIQSWVTGKYDGGGQNSAYFAKWLAESEAGLDWEKIAEVAYLIGYDVYKSSYGYFGDEDYLIVYPGHNPEIYASNLDDESMAIWENECKNDLVKVESFNSKSINENVITEDIKEQDRIQALAEYLNIDVEDVSGFGDYSFDTPEGEYIVATEVEAHKLALDDIKNLFDDLGVDSFTPNFRQWIYDNAVDTHWFKDALYECEKAYVDDIESENGRLEDELVDAGIVTPEDFESGNFDIDDAKQRYVDYLVDNMGDPIKFYKDNFGQNDFNRAVRDNDLVNIDIVAEEAIEWDGVAHFIATYDGEEIELGNGLFAYRTN